MCRTKPLLTDLCPRLKRKYCIRWGGNNNGLYYLLCEVFFFLLSCECIRIGTLIDAFRPLYPHRLRGMVVLKGRRPLGAFADDVAVYDSDEDESLITGGTSVVTGTFHSNAVSSEQFVW